MHQVNGTGFLQITLNHLIIIITLIRDLKVKQTTQFPCAFFSEPKRAVDVKSFGSMHAMHLQYCME